MAAGESRRMNGADKITLLLGGKMVIEHAVDVFQSCEFIAQIALVLSEQNLELGRGLVKTRNKVSSVVTGGRRRQDSVASGLIGLVGCDWVIVHDGARPLVTHDLIVRGLETARETGAAAAAVPVTDTIKIAGIDMLVKGTLRREELWSVQTPQVFQYDIIEKAHREIKAEVTDDASLVEKLGVPVKLYMGAYDNIKITKPTDLAVAEALLKVRSEKK